MHPFVQTNSGPEGFLAFLDQIEGMKFVPMTDAPLDKSDEAGFAAFY